MIQNVALYLNYEKALKSTQYSNEKELEQKLEFELIRSAQAGNAAAIEELLFKYRGIVAAALENINIPDYELEDLIQEALIIVFRKITTFKFNSKISTWIYRVARNTGLELYRFRKRRLVAAVSIDQPSASDPDKTMQIEDSRSTLDYPSSDLIKQCIRQLTPIQRTCLTLYYYQEYDYNQISETVGLPLGTIKTHIFRGKQTLKQMLEKYHPNVRELL